MKIAITGVPGVGKTSVAEGLKNLGYKRVSYGTLMFEVAKDRFNVIDRDHMRQSIKVSDYKKLQSETAKQISNMKGKIIVDTHTSILKKDWYYPGLPRVQLKAMGLDGIVVIEANQEDIQKRRDMDKGKRKREGDIETQQNINKMFSVAYSAISGVPVIFIKNHHNKLDEAIEAVKKACEHL